MHSLLARQLKRLIGGADQLPAGLRPFVDAVDGAYHQNDADRQMLERSLDIVSRELGARNQELRQLNAQLEQRAAELEAANQELEAFSYSVSHDLRAPLRSVDGFAQVLLDDYGEHLDDTAKSHLDRVRAASQRMAELIDGLLGLSRVTRATLTPERVELSSMATTIATGLCEAEPLRNVSFAIEPEVVARGDRRLLYGVIENLFRNAWKFSAKHERAHIQFGQVAVDGETAFFVRDDGAGFDMEYKDKLFSAFQRLHSQSEFDGSGIGLATVQRIVRRHGGRIWAEAGVERGATFYFTLGRGGG